jgi:hypothetical protein
MFIIIGSVTLLSTVVIFFGMHEENAKADSRKSVPIKTRMRDLRAGLKEALTTEWKLYVAFLANFCVKVGAIAGYTFGTLII